MAGASSGKNPLLANYLRHTTTHNKVQEEQEMWRLRNLEKSLCRQDSLKRTSSSRVRRASITTGRLLSDSYHREDDEERGGRSSMAEVSSGSQSYYWTRQLMKAEENDSNRWGHAGYKEFHPDEFVSTEESDETEEHVRKKRLKKEKTKKKLKKRKKHLEEKIVDKQSSLHRTRKKKKKKSAKE